VEETLWVEFNPAKYCYALEKSFPIEYIISVIYPLFTSMFLKIMSLFLNLSELHTTNNNKLYIFSNREF